jgi:hypothetical protein
MNGDQPKIEIFEPFGTGFELMKRILFQPFDFAKWLVIGFAAFLSGSWGSGFQFHFPMNGNWNFRSTTHHNIPTSESLPPWLIPLGIVLAFLLLIIIFVLMWVMSRGRFIFTDCVVKNRAAIVAPWQEYRREGNSFFLFSLAVMFLALVIVAVLVLLIFVPLGLFSGGKGTAAFGALAVFAMVFVGLVWLGFTIFFAVVTQFMVPVMYRRRCRAGEAFFDVSKLVLARPGPFVLFVLFGIVLVIALVLGSTIVSCLTCCIAGLPYVSSVVLLPAFVWLLAFKLLFLRQFGPEYDVWAMVDSSVPVAPAEPPIQPPPPSAPPPSPGT